MAFPPHLQYSCGHEWARVDGNRLTGGITDFAQEELGDVVFVELLAVGATVAAKGIFGVIESVKAVSDLYAPVIGTVVEVNTQLTNTPDLVNHSPSGEGWIIVIEASDPGEFQHLLSAEAYQASIEREQA